MSIERPTEGTAVVLDDSTQWEDFADLLGLDEEQAEELEEYVSDIGSMPGVVIAGDLVIDEDATTVALAKGQIGTTSAQADQVAKAHEEYMRAMEMDGYDGQHEPYVTVVLGNVTIAGALEVVQYRPLYVTGNLRAKSVRGHTGNLVVLETLHASEMVVCSGNEEGGLVWSPKIETPLSVDTGDHAGVSWRVDGQTQFDRDLALLIDVLSDRLAQTVQEGDIMLYTALTTAIESGRAGEISSEFIRRRKAASTS
jgi:hypothetical protein